jgi:hypothetical protein
LERTQHAARALALGACGRRMRVEAVSSDRAV